MNPVILWLLTIPVLVAGDLLWLGVLMKDFYKDHLGHLMAGEVNWWAAMAFYLVYSGGVIYFAVLPGISSGSFVRTIGLAALLGAFAYATYDLTNQATLRDWPVIVTTIDMLWGACLTAFVGAVAFGIATRV